MRKIRKAVTGAMIAEARHQYEEADVPIVAIAGMLGVGESTLYAWAADWGWLKRSQRAPPGSATKRPQEGAESIADLASRIQDTVDRELIAVEQILTTLGPLPADVAQAERAARTLASLSRTLREVTRLAAQTPEAKSDDDVVPRDIGELRDVVSRRLAKLVADAKTAHPDEREGA